MKKYILMLLVAVWCGLLQAQMPNNGDYSNWNWEDQSEENWKREINGNWTRVNPPFEYWPDGMNLLYEIKKAKDYTREKGWRLVHANFKRAFPYFVLYNAYTGVLRGFVYIEGYAGMPYGSTVIMTITPNENAKTTKIFHLNEDKLVGINDKSSENVFSQLAVTAVTTAGLDSWAAFEIPLLFDNTLSEIPASWTIEFFSGQNQGITLTTNGTSVPMDSKGNNLFAHPQGSNTGTSLKTDYSKVHTNIKNFAEWGDKLSKHAKGLEIDSVSSPKFLKTYKSTVSRLSNVIKVAGSVSQISAGVQVALGIFDFFFGGGSKATIPLGYSHSLQSEGTITSLNYIVGHTKPMPGSAGSEILIMPWEYNCVPGVVNITNTPTIKRSKPYMSIIDEYRNNGKNSEPYTGLRLETNSRYYTIRKYISGLSRPFRIDRSLFEETFPIVSYKMDENVSISYINNISILNVKFAIIFKDKFETNIRSKAFSFVAKFQDDSGSFPFPEFFPILLRLRNPVYAGLEKGRLQLYEYNRENKIFIYGTPYMTMEELKGVTIETLRGTDVSLGVIVEYKAEGDDEIRYFKGTYKLKEEEVSLEHDKYGILFKDEEQPNFSLNNYWASPAITLNSESSSNYNNISIKLEQGFIGKPGFRARASYAKQNQGQLNTYRFDYDCDNTSIPLVGLKSSYFQKEESNPNLNNQTDKQNYILYPNPSTGVVNFDIPTEMEVSYIVAHDMMGKRVFKKSYIENPSEIDLTGNPPGVYILKIFHEGGISENRIILK